MSKRLVLPRSGSALMLKSHVSGYTRKDGTYVQEHDDKRQKKAGGDASYSHPHVVGKSKVIDPHATGHEDASGIQFAGTEYWSTGKHGKSFHDETPVREFEAEDGHRVWGDKHGRVHADSLTEVPHLRKKFEAHSAAEQGKGAPASGKDTDSGGAPASGGEGGEQKVSKADVINATLGQHNGLGYVSVPPGKGQNKVEEFVNSIKSIGFSLDEGTTYDPNGDSVKLDANEQGKAVLTNPAGQRVVIMASDGGDRVKISVSLLDADKKPDKAAGGASGGSGAPKADKPAGGVDKPSGGDSDAEDGGEVDDASREKLYQQANAAYTKHFTDKVQPVEKAYRDGKASIEDLVKVRAESKKLMAEADAEFEKLLKAAKGKKPKGGSGQGDLFKAIASGARLLLGRGK